MLTHAIAPPASTVADAHARHHLTTAALREGIRWATFTYPVSPLVSGVTLGYRSRTSPVANRSSGLGQTRTYAKFIMPETGVLLINVGTPDAPKSREVRRYLREFLSDPRVIDIHPLGRWLLLNLFILPFRPKKSAAAYRAVWTDAGSPLLRHSLAQRDALAATLGPSYQVEVGMRYGAPSIADALERLLGEDLERLVIVPLYPQYSDAATGSSMARVMEHLEKRWNLPALFVAGAFYDDPRFIAPAAAQIRRLVHQHQPDFVLFSYHGLPERQVRRSHRLESSCDMRGPCPPVGEGHRMCYRAQCFATSAALAEALALRPEHYGKSFQSRLGRTPWVHPYTDVLLPTLAERGIKRLVVATPSFVADCLETLEEVGIRLREQWMSLGGTDFALAPCVNSDQVWVQGLGEMVREIAQGPHRLAEKLAPSADPEPGSPTGSATGAMR